jgi:cell division protein FtsL
MRGGAVALPPPSGLAAAAFDVLAGLSRHGLLDRLIRGRAWIALVAFALIGIVAMQLWVVKLGVGIGRALEHEALLQRENSTLSIEDSKLSSGERVEQLAAARGMVLALPGGLHFDAVDGPLDARLAAAALARPLSTQAGAMGTEAASTPAGTGAATETASTGAEAASTGTGSVTGSAGTASEDAPASSAAANGATASTPASGAAGTVPTESSTAAPAASAGTSTPAQAAGPQASTTGGGSPEAGAQSTGGGSPEAASATPAAPDGGTQQPSPGG